MLALASAAPLVAAPPGPSTAPWLTVLGSAVAVLAGVLMAAAGLLGPWNGADGRSGVVLLAVGALVALDPVARLLAPTGPV